MGHFKKIALEDISEIPEIKEDFQELIYHISKIAEELESDRDLSEITHWVELGKVIKDKATMCLLAPTKPEHREAKGSLEYLYETILYFLVRHHIERHPNDG